MSRKNKVTATEKIAAVKAIISGKMSTSEVAQRLNITSSHVYDWVYQYKEQGETAFQETAHNNVYSEKLKLAAVMAYINGEGSQGKIAAKYGLRSSKQLRDWIKVYNKGGNFKHKMSGGSRMSTTRKTTQAERIQIAKECLESGNNYGEIAIKYNVSYQQVYSWVKKYKALGQAGLEDRRGKRTADQEPRTEVEELKIKMAQLEHELYMTRMERDLLKKLKELERRDAFLK